MGIEAVAVALLVSAAANAVLASLKDPPEPPIDEEEDS